MSDGVTVERPRELCDVRALVAGASSDAAGVLWRLTESGRQLDANLVRLAANEHVPRHAEPELDVLLVVVAGTGTLAADGNGRLPLTPGTTVWMPRGCARSLSAGIAGLSYLTVHVRRPGMRIGPRPPETFSDRPDPAPDDVPPTRRRRPW